MWSWFTWAVESTEDVEIYAETTDLRPSFLPHSYCVACTFAQHLANVPSWATSIVPNRSERSFKQVDWTNFLYPFLSVSISFLSFSFSPSIHIQYFTHMHTQGHTHTHACIHTHEYSITLQHRAAQQQGELSENVEGAEPGSRAVCECRRSIPARRTRDLELLGGRWWSVYAPASLSLYPCLFLSLSPFYSWNDQIIWSFAVLSQLRASITKYIQHDTEQYSTQGLCYGSICKPFFTTVIFANLSSL